MKKQTKIMKVLSTEYHWWCIARYRRYLSKLYSRGVPLTCASFYVPGARLEHHCLRVQRLTSR